VCYTRVVSTGAAGLSYAMEEPIVDPRPYFERYVPAALARKRDWLRDVLRDIHAIGQIEVEGEGGGVWHFAIDGGAVRFAAGPGEAPTFTIQLSVQTFRRIRASELSPRRAFMRGKVRVQGSKPTAMKIASLLT